LKQEMLAQLQQVSLRLALHWSDESRDELPSRPQVRQDVQLPEPQQDQLRKRAPQHLASRQPSPEQQAPRQQRASRRQRQALREPPRQASPPAFSLP
jgi:hypothetical protein